MQNDHFFGALVALKSYFYIVYTISIQYFVFYSIFLYFDVLLILRTSLNHLFYVSLMLCLFVCFLSVFKPWYSVTD